MNKSKSNNIIKSHISSETNKQQEASVKNINHHLAKQHQKQNTLPRSIEDIYKMMVNRKIAG